MKIYNNLFNKVRIAKWKMKIVWSQMIILLNQTKIYNNRWKIIKLQNNSQVNNTQNRQQKKINIKDKVNSVKIPRLPKKKIKQQKIVNNKKIKKFQKMKNNKKIKIILVLTDLIHYL